LRESTKALRTFIVKSCRKSTLNIPSTAGHVYGIINNQDTSRFQSSVMLTEPIFLQTTSTHGTSALFFEELGQNLPHEFHNAAIRETTFDSMGRSVVVRMTRSRADTMIPIPNSSVPGEY
jgi:hypothetical protein